MELDFDHLTSEQLLLNADLSSHSPKMVAALKDGLINYVDKKQPLLATVSLTAKTHGLQQKMVNMALRQLIPAQYILYRQHAHKKAMAKFMKI